jgi:hypothetical protein
VSSFFIVFYAALFAAAVAIFVFNLRAYHQSRTRVGEVRAHWTIRFNFAFPENWLILALVLGYAAVCAVLLITKPRSIDGYHWLVILMVGMAFYPRFNFVDIGTEGVLDRRIFIPWSAVNERRVVEDKGRRYLELRITPGPGVETGQRLKRIRVPKNISLVLD